MSDRIDEQRREEQRIEQQRLQRSLAAKKQGEVKESFAHVVKQIKENNKTQDKREQVRQTQAASGQSGLNARRGIENRNLTRQVLSSGEARAFKGRRDFSRSGEESNVSRGAAADQEAERLLAKAGQRSVVQSRPGAKDSEQDKGDARRTKEGDRPDAAQRRGEEALAAAGLSAQQTVQGVSAQETSTSGAGLHTDLQQIINELVDAVHKGVDKNNFGFMHIELKSHVLSGSSLSLQSTPEGINLKIQTDDDEVARLLSSGNTAQELGRTLESRGVKLKSFEVNAERVLG